MQLVALTAHRFPSSISSLCSAIAAAIIGNDHAGGIAADIIQLWSVPHSAVVTPSAASELLRELGHVGSGDAKDSASLRRAANFIMDVSTRVPDLVMTNIAVLMPYLECDSQALRSALVNSLGSILVKETEDAVASTGVEGQQTATHGLSESTRDSLYEVLLARAYDVHSLTRSAVLKCLLQLVESGALPTNRLVPVTQLAMDRVKDKGALVRKAAAQLLRGLVENNPFGPHLNADPFDRQANISTDWLDKHDTPQSQMQQIATAEGSILSEEVAAPAVVDPEVSKHQKIVEGCKLASAFCKQIQASVVAMALLMNSKSGTDVMESIRYLAKCRSFGVPGAEQSLAKMLTLIWSGDAHIREEVVRRNTLAFVIVGKGLTIAIFLCLAGHYVCQAVYFQRRFG
jgi:condensin complex subunit 1